jgi:ribosome biogenesis protein SSF1/2
MRKQYVFEKLFQNAPLIVLNSISGEGLHMKLMASMFQNMFPTINITKVRTENLTEVIEASVAFMCAWCCRAYPT